MTRRAFVSALLLAALAVPATAEAPTPSKTGDDSRSVKRKRRRRRGTSRRKTRKAVIGLVTLVALGAGFYFKRKRDKERYAALDD